MTFSILAGIFFLLTKSYAQTLKLRAVSFDVAPQISTKKIVSKCELPLAVSSNIW